MRDLNKYRYVVKQQAAQWETLAGYMLKISMHA